MQQTSSNFLIFYGYYKIILKASLHYYPNQSFVLKITLKEMDMVLIEDTEDPHSLALVGFTTGVFTAHDVSSILEGNFEIQVCSFYLFIKYFIFCRRWIYAGVRCQWKKIVTKTLKV